MAYKLVDLLYKLEMDGFEWEELFAELERKKEVRKPRSFRIRESVYKEFIKACDGYVIVDVVELLMILFIRHRKIHPKKKNGERA